MVRIRGPTSCWLQTRGEQKYGHLGLHETEYMRTWALISHVHARPDIGRKVSGVSCIEVSVYSVIKQRSGVLPWKVSGVS